MKAILYNGEEDFRVGEVQVRSLYDDEVLVKIEGCGICGTDLHIVEGKSKSTPPVVLGHEYIGYIDDPGRFKEDFPAGTRVAIDPNIWCGRCYYCRRGLIHLCSSLLALGVDINGGMAEYCIVPVKQLYKISDKIPTERAIFIEPLSCILHGLDRVKIKAGDTVVIIGAGTVGLLMLQMARSVGAVRKIIIEPADIKRDIAKLLGADVVMNPLTDNVRDIILDYTSVGADVVIECVGKQETMQAAVTYSRRGGIIVFYGVCPIGSTIPIEPFNVFYNELTIMGSYINPFTFERAIKVLESDIIRTDLFKIKNYHLDEVYKAFESLRRGDTVKNIIVPG